MKKFIKYSIAIISLVFFAQIIVAQAAPADKKGRLAIRMIANSLKESSRKMPLNESAYRAEIADKSKKSEHLDSARSREIIKAMVKEDIVTWYRKEMARILQSVDESVIGAEEREGILNPSDSSFGENVNFETLFEKIRKEVVEQERAGLKLNIYPTEEQIDTMSDKELRVILWDRVKKTLGEPVYQENEKYISKEYLTKVLIDASDQKANQEDIVEKFCKESTIMIPSVFVSSLTEKIQISIDDIKDMHPYKIFPSVAKEISDQRVAVARGNILTAIGAIGFEFKDKEKERIENTILSDLVGHNETSVSRRIITSNWEEGLKNDVINFYAEKISDEAEKAEFKRFFRLLAKKDVGIISKLDELVDKTVERDFPGLRQKISEKQFKDNFTPLVNKTWRPKEEDLVYFHTKVPGVRISKPLKVKGIAKKAFNPDAMIEETAELVKIPLFELSEEGLQALKNQLQIVEDVVIDIKANIADVAKGDDIFGTFIEKFDVKWNADLLSKKYIKRFEYVDKKIKEKLKELIQYLENTLPKIKPGGSGSMTMGTADKKLELPGKDYVPGIMIDIYHYKNFLKLRLNFLLNAEEMVYEYNIEENGRKINGWLVEKISKNFGSWIGTLIAGEGQDENVVVVRVFSRRIDYGIVNDVRTILSDKIKENMDYIELIEIKFRWLDDLFPIEEKNNRTSPDEMKNRRLNV